MAADINVWTGTGRLTRDAELKQTKSGTHVLQFGLAVNGRRKNQSGEWEDKPNFIDCTMFGDKCLKLQQYMTKGTKLAVAGELDFQSWQAEDGSKRSKLGVVVRDFSFMSSANGGNGQQVSHPAQTNQAQQQGADGDYYDADIPF